MIVSNTPLPLMLRYSIKSLLCASVMLSITLTGCFESQRELSINSDSDMATPTQDDSSKETLASALQSPSTVGANKLIVPEISRRDNVSQQFVGVTPTEVRLALALPEIPYSIDDLPARARVVNNAVLLIHSPIDEALIIKAQALLNYHHHSVGAIDGRMGQNVIKAMQIFQQDNSLQVTQSINAQTWHKLTENADIKAQPVLVNYTLTQKDVDLLYHPKGQQYRSIREAVAEKFHMSQGLLSRLNPDTRLQVGNTIVVYNPYQPNANPVHRIKINKQKNILLAYDDNDALIASYPTTVGSRHTPSPSGHYKILNRVINPSYNNNFSNKDSVLPPGPNNPVGRVWMGINKVGYGIHGSPNPEKISQQTSSGCVRLTNWDALGLFGSLEIGAIVDYE